MKRGRRIAKTLLCALGMFCAPSVATAQGATARGEHGVSADFCSRHPELFKVRPLNSSQAMALVRPTGEHLTIIGFERGYVVSGACTGFIKRFGNGIVLTNNAAFGIQDLTVVPARPADPGDGPPPSYFVPPKNIITIAADRFAEGSGRSYVKKQRDIVLWSGPKGSALGIIHCSWDGNVCSLDHLILSSPYRIRNFGFVPAPHTEMHSGNLWLQIALPHGKEASANYAISWGQEP